MRWSLKYCVIVSFIGICGLGFGASSASAIYNPGSVPNNKYGVHILDPQEIGEAAKLVNSSGGDWGYVTVPIRSNDRDRNKWLTFFARCKDMHLIPIIRLSTYPDQKVWFEPDVYDLVDFANFLNDMPWPTQNRYIVLFNEPNHATEWGGRVDPLSYVHLLIEAKSIFKSRSQDFFLLSAGLDMSAPNSATSRDALLYYRQMTAYQPDWYSSIDGLSIHAYPNPTFSAPTYSTTRFGLKSYTYETAQLKSLGFAPKPMFVTETGSLRPDQFYPSGVSQVLVPDANIIAVTPFLLFAGSPDFAGFSLLDTSHNPKASYLSLRYMPKIAGSPLVANTVVTPATGANFVSGQAHTNSGSNLYIRILNFLFRKPKTPTLTLGSTTIAVEIMDTDVKRASGLSGRASLPNNTGMLFVFPSSAKHSFWMKDMQFALDFVWIQDSKIVQLTANVPPPDQTNTIPQVIFPKNSVTMVLEVPAGFISQHQLKVGDSTVVNSTP